MDRCRKFLVLSFGLALLALSFTRACYSFNLDKLKSSFLSGDYKSVISEGEKILAGKISSGGLDELYYILGLSYMKDGNLLRASDIFEIILSEYKNSLLKEYAKLGLADTYFLRQDFNKAEADYKDIINSNPDTKLKAEIYYRLSEVGFKKGDTKEGNGYLDKLKQEFPASQVLEFDKDLCYFSQTSPSDRYYSVQVGSFSNIANAKNLVQRLLRLGYAAYIEEASFEGKNSYRVKAGKARERQEIVDLENRLSKEGYPTRICP